MELDVARRDPAKKRIANFVAFVASTSLVVIIDHPSDTKERLKDMWGALAGAPIPSALLGLFLLMIVWLNWEAIWGLWFHVPRWKTDQDFGDEIHAWLRQRRYGLQETARDGVSFSFAVRTDEDRTVEIVKPRDGAGLVVGTAITITTEHRSILEAMDEDEMEDLLGDLALEFAKMPYPMSMSAQDIVQKGVRVWHNFDISESLTPLELTNVIAGVSAGNLVAHVVLRRHIRKAAKRIPSVQQSV